MSYFKKKVFFSFLTLTSLSLAILSPIYAADEEDLRVLKNARKTPLSPDEKCQKKIKKFNKMLDQNLSFQEQIQLYRDLYSYLQKYEKDSKIAEEILPIAQHNLGVALTNSAVKESPEATPLLRNALELFIHSANAGYPKAKEFLPIAQHNFGLALVDQYELSLSLAYSSANLAQQILLLKEASELFINSASAGFQFAVEDLPVVQDILKQASQHLTNLLGAGGSTP